MIHRIRGGADNRNLLLLSFPQTKQSGKYILTELLLGMQEKGILTPTMETGTCRVPRGFWLPAAGQGSNFTFIPTKCAWYGTAYLQL